MESKTILITQARTGSSRLPGKILKKVNDQELLKIHLERLSRCKNVDQIVVATTVEQKDQKVADLLEEWGIKYFRGSEDDVLDRFYQTLQSFKTRPEWVVRVTSDCPLLDPILVDDVIQFAREATADYIYNGLFYPDGQDIEVIKFSALEEAWKKSKKKFEREHVTPYIRNNSDLFGKKLFKSKSFPYKVNYSEVRMTVDDSEDFDLVSKLIKDLGTETDWLTYTKYIIENSLSKTKSKFIRNEE